MRYDLLIDILTYSLLALLVIVVLYWLFKQIAAPPGKTEVRSSRSAKMKGRGIIKRIASDTDTTRNDRREKLIMDTEAKRKEVQKKMMAKFAADNPEKAAKLVRSLLIKNKEQSE